MDLGISVMLKRIEIVQVKIKDHCIAVSVNLNCVIGSLQVAKIPSEVSSSQDKSIPMVEGTILGFGDMTTQIASKLLGGPNYRQIISIVGMGGLGKTTLAKKIYNDSNVRYYYHKLSWCVVSQTYKKRKLLINILRYLIVMDDLWDTKAWDDLKRLFPDDGSGRVLFTSRLKNVALEISHLINEPPPVTM